MIGKGNTMKYKRLDVMQISDSSDFCCRISGQFLFSKFFNGKIGRIPKPTSTVNREVGTDLIVSCNKTSKTNKVCAI